MNEIERFFLGLWDVSSLSTHPAPAVTIEEQAYPAFMSCSTTQLEDIPTMLVPYVLKTLALRGNFESIAFNLTCGYDSEGRRSLHHKTVSTILRRINSVSHCSERIAHIITSKGVHYYGGHGLILDADYNPLLISTASLRIQNGSYNLTDPVCKISYRVFNNASELLEKTIIKQAIPLYSNRRVYCQKDNTSDNAVWVKVIIDDLDYMVSKPVRPRIADVTPESINNIILRSNDGL